VDGGACKAQARSPSELLPAASPRRRVEIVSSGVDEFLQTIGSDPYGGLEWPGLRVPSTATANLANVSPLTPASVLRYLFVLASFTIPEGARARIVSLRTAWTLGDVQGNRVIEHVVTNPFFRLPDGNVSFHLRQSSPSENIFAGDAVGVGNIVPMATSLPNLAFRNSLESAMLFESITFSAPTVFYQNNVSAYVPPNGGQPYGRTIAAGYGTFQDIRMQYAAGNDWGDVDIPVDGPATVQLFASVRQSDIKGRPSVSLPLPLGAPAGLSSEEQFLLNFPKAIIWRVAGSLGVELEDMR
jgi:hypothetical protein